MATTSNAKRTFTATAPDGTIHTRKSAHDYTHAVLVTLKGETRFGAYRFSASQALADKAAREIRAWGVYGEIVVVPATAA